MNNDYNFDLLVSEEDFRINKELGRKRMEKAKRRKAKKDLVSLSILLVLIIFTMFLSIKKFDMNASVCDAEKGYTCSYYEVTKSVR